MPHFFRKSNMVQHIQFRPNILAVGPQGGLKWVSLNLFGFYSIFLNICCICRDCLIISQKKQQVFPWLDLKVKCRYCWKHIWLKHFGIYFSSKGYGADGRRMREQLSGRNKGSASPSHDLQLALDGRFAKRREFEDFLSNETESQRSKEDSSVSQEKSVRNNIWS